MAFQPGSLPTGATDVSGIVNAVQQSNSVLTQILAALRGGVAIEPLAPSYAVASLPAVATVGQLAYAANGRKSGQGPGAGTGVLVTFDVSNVWIAAWSSAQVLA